jgi:peroxiredoxin
MQRRDHFARARVMALIQTLALAAAFLVGILWYPLAVAANAAPSDRVLAPDFVLRSTDGKNLRLSEYRGDVVVLAFWASWCGPCRATLAGLNGYRSETDSGGVEVLGISLDADADRAGSIANSLSLEYPTLIDARQVVGRLYDVGKLPYTLLLDRDGIVRAEWTGASPPQDELALQIEEISK